MEQILTSGRGVELVVGLAASGKTTALAAARDAFEAAGYELVGTSTSGQAARTLGREAGIAESRTLASLNWRIAHDGIRLSPRHMAVLDEAAMTDDGALLAFLEAARETRTKVVMVGDHRQLSAVGPGGGFEALVSRFGGAVHVLTDNVRQVDPAERTALSHLRSGDVHAAVAWYAGNGRIAVSPDRDTALDATVAGWAADVAKGTDTAMYAWRRANVAELNRRGRAAFEAMGRLTGPELLVGATGYRAGDRIVTLAPGANGEVVTSECGTVLAVDVRHGDMVATMDDGRLQRFAGQDLDPGHLAHGYAVTVHRAQGATVARAHVLADGGGRELAYVKMSRSKERTTLYPVAATWSRPWRTWAGLGRHPGASAGPSTGLCRRRTPRQCRRPRKGTRPCRPICATLGSWLNGRPWPPLSPLTPAGEYHRVQRDVQRLEQRLEALDKGDGWGELRGTPVGDAAIAWKQAVGEQQRCLSRAQHAGLREGHQLRKQAARAGDRVEPLRQAFEALAGPERAHIRAPLPDAKKRLGEIEGQYYGHMHFKNIHPEALRRLDRLDREIATAAWEMDVDRQGLDGIAAQRPELPQPGRGFHRDARVLERTIEFDRGFGLEL